MSHDQLQNLKLDTAMLSVSTTNDELNVKLSGVIKMENPSSHLIPYFLELHEKVLEAGVKESKFRFHGAGVSKLQRYKSLCRLV